MTAPAAAGDRSAPTRASVARVLVIALAFGGYLGLSRVVYDLYPFSTFAMYGTTRTDSGSRIVARRADGRLAEVDRFVGWACEGLPAVEDAACPGAASLRIGYLDDEALSWVRDHAAPGGGGEAVEVVRQIWRLRPDTPGLRSEACVLARCTAVPR